VRFACNGECPKHRFLKTPDGEWGLNYLCAGYKKFFTHIDPYMKTMTQLLNARRAPAEIMQMLAQAPTKAIGRNDPCPCGSGRNVGSLEAYSPRVRRVPVHPTREPATL
jgi:uncharacterized protein